MLLLSHRAVEFGSIVFESLDANVERTCQVVRDLSGGVADAVFIWPNQEAVPVLDASIPLTTFEYDEWGNPANKPYYDYMLGYSPYDNVAAKAYPAILAMGGLTDPRVTYWEPAKWVARLRATMTGGGPVLLRTNMGAGHGGSSGRFSRLEEVALAYAFALRSVGLGSA